MMRLLLEVFMFFVFEHKFVFNAESCFETAV